MNKLKQKIVIAMSGGVDSSVAAALLKKEGYDVIGVFMKFWKPDIGGGQNYCWENTCCSEEAEQTARRVAGQLNIPFYVFDFKEEFKKEVVDYFLKTYSLGKTPNPCVVCNKKIKFGILLKRAKALGANFVATGHYIRKSKVESPACNAMRSIAGRQKSKVGEQKLKGKEKYALFKGKDKKKDQSYFLWTLNQNKLKNILFPLGNYTKERVREMAREFGLPVCQKESFDICFVPARNATHNDAGGPARNATPASIAKRSFAGWHNDAGGPTRNATHSVAGGLTKYQEEFFKKYLKLRSGLIVLVDGKVIGEHRGLPLYTVGQRKGINIGGIGPFYVVELDYKNNRLIVSSDKNDKKLFKKELIVKDVNWSLGRVPENRNIKASIRYNHKPEVIEKIEEIGRNKYKVFFKKAQRAVSPGQSIVFYRNMELLGGGVII